MRIHPGLVAAAGRLTNGTVAIGNFDGVHVGHRALFQTARASSHARNGPCAALTFDPHPAQFLAPEFAPPLICTPARKRELLAEVGVDDLVLQPFDRAFAQTSPEAFVEALLATGAHEVVVGHDFTYGKNRGGSVDSLRLALEERGVVLRVLSAVAVHGLVVSSTKIREFALEGRVEACASLLGRPFDVDGEVVQGAGRGRKLGWPTANVRTPSQLLPNVGVYAVRVRRIEAAAPGRGPATPRLGPSWPGAANLGLNPTFAPPGGQAAGPRPLQLEVHLLDRDEDLYGQWMRVEFIHRLREERRFNGPDALREQIGRDVAEVRRLLGA